VWRGLAEDQDEVAAVAASKWLFVQAEYTRTPVDALREIRMAEALAERVREMPAARGEALNNLGVVYLDAGQYERSQTALELALAVKRQTYGSEDPELVATLNNLGILASGLNDATAAAARFVEAEAIAESTLGADHPFTIAIQSALGLSYRQLGRLRDADKVLSQAHERVVRVRGVDASDSWKLLALIGQLSLVKRDLPAAQAIFEKLLVHEEQIGLMAISVRAGIAEVAALQGEVTEVRGHTEQVIALSVSTFGADNPETAGGLRWAAQVLVQAGQAEEAAVHLERARQTLTKAGAAEGLPMAEVLDVLGVAYHQLGRSVEAETELRRALAIREAAATADSPALAGNLHHLAEVLRARGQAAEAVLLLRRAVAIYGAVSDADYPELAFTRFSLARALRDSGGAKRRGEGGGRAGARGAAGAGARVRTRGRGDRDLAQGPGRVIAD
jgi:tetratricopeptide (TPR) repeat protein